MKLVEFKNLFWFDGGKLLLLLLLLFIIINLILI